MIKLTECCMTTSIVAIIEAIWYPEELRVLFALSPTNATTIPLDSKADGSSPITNTQTKVINILVSLVSSITDPSGAPWADMFMLRFLQAVRWMHRMRRILSTLSRTQEPRDITIILNQDRNWNKLKHTSRSYLSLIRQTVALCYDEAPTSLNQIDHIMTYHDMSSNVTMLNWKTFHDIIIERHFMAFDDIFQFNMVTFHDIWSYLVTFHAKTCCLSWYIMTCHDKSSWNDSITLIQRGMKWQAFLCIIKACTKNWLHLLFFSIVQILISKYLLHTCPTTPFPKAVMVRSLFSPTLYMKNRGMLYAMLTIHMRREMFLPIFWLQ